MAEGAETEHDRNVLLLTDFEEASEVALAVPAEDALLLLDMVPEDIGGDDGDASFFHLPHFRLPFVSRDTRIVYLAHDGDNSFTSNDEAFAVPTDFA